MEEQKHIIVTGATNGIGEVTALELAKDGHYIVIIGRNEEKCQATVAKIKAESGGGATYLLADFASVKSTRQVAEQYLKKFDRLDMLINNAGAVFGKRQEVDGIEKHIVVNHLAPFVLTNTLLPLLAKTAKCTSKYSRVINVNSDAHYSGINWDDLHYKQDYPRFGSQAYGQSKALNLVYSLELAKRTAGTGVTVNALHPGVVRTQIFDGVRGPLVGAILRGVFRFSTLSQEEGAKTTLMLARSGELEGVSGKYYSVLKEKRPLRTLRDEEIWAKVWALTEKWVEQAKI